MVGKQDKRGETKAWKKDGLNDSARLMSSGISLPTPL